MHGLLEALPRHAPRFARELSQKAFERGLAVTKKDGGRTPIPVTGTVVVLDERELRRRADLAASLSSATFKMAKAALSGPHKELIAGALSPLERHFAELTFEKVARLATVRVDFFVSDKPMALEVNATIPAMQGYSDIAADTFIEVVGGYAGLPANEISRLIDRNGSNSRALFDALMDGYAQERGGARPARMALLCRRMDSQLTEQLHLAKRFSEWGVPAVVVHPDELSFEGGKVSARGSIFDLVYRHLFVRRLEELSLPEVVSFYEEVPGRRAVLLNPPVSQVEVKALFGLLSQAASDAALAQAASLTPAELSTIREAVPWTRPFRPGPATGPSGEQASDLVALVASDPARYVLKRSWDYGGKAVFVGASIGEMGYDERVKAAYGELLDWPSLCRKAAADPVGGGFVVQELVRAVPEKHLVCSTDGQVREVEMYVDFSAYASVGLSKQPAWGGVCRGSPSQIVNILGGGGVLPLLTAEVADALLAALSRKQ